MIGHGVMLAYLPDILRLKIFSRGGKKDPPKQMSIKKYIGTDRVKAYRKKMRVTLPQASTSILAPLTKSIFIISSDPDSAQSCKAVLPFTDGKS